MNEAQVIALYRPTLQSIAMNMLGSIADAEDVVHDAFLKWLTIDASKIINTKAFLIKTVTNNCINFLKRPAVKRTDGSIDEMAYSLSDASSESKVVKFDLDGQLTEAWRVLHRKLEPVEKTIYVLREVFNIDYEDLQHIVDKSSENCRKLFSRAKAKLKADLPSINIEKPVAIRLPGNFKIACKVGQLSGLIADLTSDIRLKGKK